MLMRRVSATSSTRQPTFESLKRQVPPQLAPDHEELRVERDRSGIQIQNRVSLSGVLRGLRIALPTAVG